MRKDNPKLLKKLKEYSALSGSLVAISGLANAQVVYTDIDPDVVLSSDGDQYQLDLENNGIFDYVFQTTNPNSGYYYAGVYMYYLSNEIAGTLKPNYFGANYGYPYALAQGEIIDDGLAFINIYDLLFSTTGGNGPFFFVPGLVSIFGGNTVGNWIGVTDHYLGLKFTDGTDFFFGWARCDATADGSTIVIKDYAYNATPETAIGAGEGQPIGIAENNSKNFRVFGYEGVVNIMINDKDVNGAIVTVTNTLGQTVIHQSLNDVITRINLNGYGKGIYLVTIQRGSEQFAMKVSFR